MPAWMLTCVSVRPQLPQCETMQTLERFGVNRAHRSTSGLITDVRQVSGPEQAATTILERTCTCAPISLPESDIGRS
jgi:hypothetical protein